MKKSIVILLLLTALVLSCGTTPKPPEASSEVEEREKEEEVPSAPYEEKGQLETIVEAPVVIEIPVVVETPVVDTFDPDNVSEEVFKAAKTEITVTILELNWIIKAKDYKAWVTHLSEPYFTEISSKAFLDEKTEELYRRDQIVAQNLGRDPNLVDKKMLRTPMDYFINVVVPARANDKLDDISFLTETRVRAYTVDERRGQRLILYDLAHIDDKWLIVN
jgi:membrane-associated protease RseP (regulator of RpoE activity)